MTLLDAAGGAAEVPLASKAAVADAVFDRVAALLAATGPAPEREGT